ncbi:hypothetical protein QOT17_015032 [Balamuthia mandrillaris]
MEANLSTTPSQLQNLEQARSLATYVPPNALCPMGIDASKRCRRYSTYEYDGGDVTYDGGDVEYDGGDVEYDGGDVAYDGNAYDGGDVVAYNTGDTSSAASIGPFRF